MSAETTPTVTYSTPFKKIESFATSMPVATDGIIHPLIKPGPVFTYVPPPVLSRASQKTNNARAINIPVAGNAVITNMPTTFVTSAPYIFDNPGPVLTAITPAADPSWNSNEARDAPTSITNSAGSIVAGDEQLSRKGSVNAATIGWVIAVVVACLMTACGVWLVLRKRPGRMRRTSYRIRRSQGTEMVASGAQGGPPARE